MTKKKKAANNNGMTAGSSVGYGNPPKHAQFQKGKSGNPKGRPKGSQNLGALLLSCPRIFWTPICPTGGIHDEVEHEPNRNQRCE